MNYYQRHIGDYLRDTTHLSLLEHGVFGRLLDLYYLNEGPLTADISQLCRKVGAARAEEKAAVEIVLAEFFTLEDGYRNRRADQEIAEFRRKELKSDEKAAHENARLTRHRARRAEMFDALRASGVFPDWNIPIRELERLYHRVEQTDNAPATAPATASEMPLQRACNTPETETATHLQRACNGLATAIPLTINQDIPPSASQSPPKRGAAVAAEPVVSGRKRVLPGDWQPKASHRELAQSVGKNLEREVAQFRDHHLAKGNKFTDWDLALNTWLRRNFNTTTTQKHDDREQRRAREFPESIQLKSIDLRAIAEQADATAGVGSGGGGAGDFGAERVAEAAFGAQNAPRAILAGSGGASAVVYQDRLHNGPLGASGRRENATGGVGRESCGANGQAGGLSNGYGAAAGGQLAIL